MGDINRGVNMGASNTCVEDMDIVGADTVDIELNTVDIELNTITNMNTGDAAPSHHNHITRSLYPCHSCRKPIKKSFWYTLEGSIIDNKRTFMYFCGAKCMKNIRAMGCDCYLCFRAYANYLVDHRLKLW